MAKAFDILLDEEDELEFANGDFAVGISEAQNLDHLTRAVPGSMKGEPTTGIGIVRYMKRRMNVVELYSEVKEQLKADNWQNESLYINEQEVTINGERDE